MVVERGRVKNFKPGKVKKSETMDASITIELTYILIEVDGPGPPPAHWDQIR